MTPPRASFEKRISFYKSNRYGGIRDKMEQVMDQLARSKISRSNKINKRRKGLFDAKKSAPPSIVTVDAAEVPSVLSQEPPNDISSVHEPYDASKDCLRDDEFINEMVAKGNKIYDEARAKLGVGRTLPNQNEDSPLSLDSL
jgi:hypothetical protein